MGVPQGREAFVTLRVTSANPGLCSITPLGYPDKRWSRCPVVQNTESFARAVSLD